MADKETPAKSKEIRMVCIKGDVAKKERVMIARVYRENGEEFTLVPPPGWTAGAEALAIRIEQKGLAKRV